MPLLDVPEGASPYVVYLHEITKEIYGEPDRGLNARFIVLLCVTCYYTLLSFLYTSSVVGQSLIRNGGGGVWLLKKVPLGDAGSTGSHGGRYLLVSNTKIALGAGAASQGVYLIFYLIDGMNVYLYHGNQRNEFPLRAVLPFPICTVAWFLSWGILQAFTLMHTDKQRQISWAPWLNRGFIWGAVFWLLYSGVWAVISARAGLRYWHNNESLSRWLEAAQATYTGSLSPAETLDLDRRYISYLHVRNRYATFAQILYGSLPGFAVTVFVINVSTVLLTRMIKFRINKQLANMTLIRAHAFEAHDVAMAPLERCLVRQMRFQMMDSDANEEDKKGPEPTSFIDAGAEELARTWPGASLSPRSGPSLNISNLRQIAGQGETSISAEEMDRLHAVQVLELDATRKFLALVGTLIAACASGRCAVAIYVTTTIRADGPFFYNWARFEMTIYSFPWAVGLLVGFMMTLLLRIQMRSRSLWLARKKSRLMIRQHVQVEVEGP